MGLPKCLRLFARRLNESRQSLTIMFQHQRICRRHLSLGVPNEEFRHYGEPAEHRAAHGLDAAGIRASLERFVGRAPVSDTVAKS